MIDYTREEIIADIDEAEAALEYFRHELDWHRGKAERARKAHTRADQLRTVEVIETLIESCQHRMRFCEEFWLPRCPRERKAEQRRVSAGRAEWQRLAPKLRPVILARFDYTCVACGSHDELHIDHIVALAVGGTNDESNLQVLCGPCNIAKGIRPWLG